MKKYLWIVVCFIWITLCGINLYKSLWHVGDDSTYTSVNDRAYNSITDTYYITDNVDYSGFVYAIGPDNKVKALFDADGYAKGTYCDELTIREGQLFVLIYGSTTIDTVPVRAYSIVQLDTVTLEPIAHTGWFRTYDGGEVQHISKDEQYFYMSEISKDDMQARIYAIPLDSLVEVTDGDDNNIRNVATIRYSASVEPSEGYFFVYAGYDNGQLNTMENGNGLLDDEVFDVYAAQRFEHKIFTAKQIAIINKDKVKYRIFFALAGVLFILALTFFVKQRNRVAYLIVIWEVMLVLLFGYAAYKLNQWNNTTNWDEMLKFVSFTVDDVRADLDELEQEYENTENYYRTEEFVNITSRLRHVVQNYGNGSVFVNLISIARLDNGEFHVVAAAKGLNNCSLETLYGNEAVDLAKKVYSLGLRSNSQVSIDGKEYSLICVGQKGETNPTSMLMAVIDQNGSDDLAISEMLVVYIVIVLLFILASIVGVTILRRQAKDLRLLGNTMMDVSQGGVGIKKPDTLGEDMSDMWSGLLDIDRSIKNLNYIKYRTFEAYYKFAPKSVERLLDKTSITEVGNGDMVQKKGTIMLIDTNTNKMLLGLAKMNNSLEKLTTNSKAKEVLELLSKYQEENIAYKISAASDLSEMDLVMPDNVIKACEVGVEMSKAYDGVGYGACIFMHYTNFLYGVAIAGDEASQYLLSGEMMRIRNKLLLLNELRISMVVTGTVLERELEKPSNRYIGYWDIGDNTKIELYEVLDACSDEFRHMREETKELFEEGLELFYENNYYLARNNFAKVIKIDHCDSVARWYLFTCEKHLDGSLKTEKYELSE